MLGSILNNERSWAILQGDAVEVLRTMPAESIHCVVTSPPYWGLRDYGVAGQLGLEKTPEEYVEKMVEIFREVRRVLRSDGTLWLNLGDSYAGSWGNYGGKNRGSGTQREILRGSKAHQKAYDDLSEWRPPASWTKESGLKPKNLVGIPWRVAFALQADGWWLRSDIVWSKPNPMPESVTDRPTRAHEYIFLMTKSEKYFYDAEAIKEESVCGVPNSPESIKSPYGQGFTRRAKADKQRGHGRRHDGFNDRWDSMTKKEQGAMGRNKRSVWSVATHPFPEAHFATFPPKLIEPCILAGTSERGCCSRCGAPNTRIVKKSGGTIGKGWHDHQSDTLQGQRISDQDGIHGRNGREAYKVETVGWKPSCSCETGSEISCIVFDLFSGAGTTGLVSNRLGRRFIGIELNPEYVDLAKKRIINDAQLFNPVES